MEISLQIWLFLFLFHNMASKVNSTAGEYAFAYKNYSTADAQKRLDNKMKKAQEKNRKMYDEDSGLIAVDNNLYKYNPKSTSKYKITENLKKAVFKAKFQKKPDKKIKANKTPKNIVSRCSKPSQVNEDQLLG